MTARIAIEREQIIAAAIDLIRTGGWDAVSARAIAQGLGSSTMPIYSAIGSMDDLKQAAFVTAALMLSAAQRKPRTGNEALDLAVGYVAFAREEPGLFKFVMSIQRDMGPRLLEAVESPQRLGGIQDIEMVQSVLGTLSAPKGKEDLLLRSWIFAHGLAQLVAEGTLVLDEKEIVRHLQEAGGSFYLFEKRKEERA
jgi:AcrR family transcriptional regulator